MRGRRTFFVGLALVALVAAGCGRSSKNSANPPSTSTTAASSADRLAKGDFGDLTGVCKSGNAKGATAQGVTDTDIRIGVFTDKGATVKPGLTKEMWDASQAFAKWCNSKGGILGRQIKLDDRDAKLFEYAPAINDACAADFSLVGGGAVFDDADNGKRVQCGLTNIAAYLVTPVARTAKLQVQPVPNPVYELPVGSYKLMGEAHPDIKDHFGLMTGNIPTTKVVRDQTKEALEQIGFKIVYDQEYNALGESDWRPFVQKMQSAGVKGLYMVGEPENLVGLEKAMQTVGWYPDVIIQEANFYDQKFVQDGGAAIKNTWVRTAFWPFELASTNKAMSDYLELMKDYNPGGKIAGLGAQSISAWLLFAKAAAECGSNLTRDCLMQKAAVTSWTGGGLHGETDPKDNKLTTCVAIMKAGNGVFTYDKTDTKPNTQGVFNCDPSNAVELHGDYGVPKP
jgi:ABC-type branched-subunit amino acid transport system substrate-binding protein